MEITQVNKIYANAPLGLKTKLEHLKRYLSSGRASVMVGAGFSFNAKIPEGAQMLSWKGLAERFYQCLYLKLPDDKERESLNPMQLSQMLEANFKESELEGIIKESLTDNLVLPGELHQKLLQLPWRDVFTTNYDTLLERAGETCGRSYQTVLTKQGLAYSKSPRIIKLHGSFPECRPFIITEEQFRTYPQKYPEFVNTVRQSLIENMFCLVGFSGNDPNFKSWLGWVRDVVGKDYVAPVYLITYNTALQEPDIKWYDDIGIKYINTADIKGIESPQQGIDFVLSYLSNDAQLDWSCDVKTKFQIASKEDLLDISNQMKTIRESYPGYLFLPHDNHSYYDIMCKIYDNIDLMQDTFGKMSHIEQIDYLYEIVWRLEISALPILSGDLVDAIVKFDIYSENYGKETQAKMFSLYLAIVTMLRTHGEYQRAEELVNELLRYEDRLNSDQIDRCYYEWALMNTTLLHYEQVRTILLKWNKQPNDLKSSLWKACIYAYLGEEAESIKILNFAYQTVCRRIAVNNDNQLDKWLSYKAAIYRALSLYERRKRDELLPKKFEIDDINNLLFMRVQRGIERPIVPYSVNHGFNIAQISSHWHLGSDNTNQLAAFSYFRLDEITGYPFGLHNTTIEENNKLKCVSQLSNLFPEYALDIMVLSGSKTVINEILNRKFLKDKDSKLFNTFNLNYITTIEQCLERKIDKILVDRCLKVVLPMLSKMGVRLPQDVLMRLYRVWMKVFVSYKMNYDQDLVKLLCSCMSKEDQIQSISRAMEMPIENDIRKDDFYMLIDGNKNSVISESVVNNIREGLKSEEKDIQGSSLQRIYTALHCKISPDMRDELFNIVRKWRSEKKDSDLLRYSWTIVPFRTGETINPIKIDEEDYEELIRMSITQINSSESILELTHRLAKIQNVSVKFNNAQNINVISHVTEFLRLNENLLKKNDKQEFFGGFHSYTQELINRLQIFIANIKWNEEYTQSFDELNNLMLRYKDYGYGVLSILLTIDMQSRHSGAVIDKMIIAEITNPLTELSVDIRRAILYKLHRKGNVTHILHKLVQTCKILQTQQIYQYLLAIGDIVDQCKIPVKKHNMLGALLKELYERIPLYGIPEEYRCDMLYATVRLAGYCYQHLPQIEGVNLWQTYVERNDVFNDVKMGYYVE